MSKTHIVEMTLEEACNVEIGIAHCSKMYDEGAVKYDVKQYYRMEAQALVATVQAFYTRSHEKEQIVRYPKTWWQHFKQRFFTEKMLIKWPVIEEEVTVCFHLKFPRCQLPERLQEYNIHADLNNV